MRIRVVNPGFLTMVQDLGRPHYAHLGISSCGAADRLSFRVANLLVGNDENAAALEMTLLGATLDFEERAMVAITGAECGATLNGVAVPAGEAFEVPAGYVLRCGTLTHGARAYLAVRGGFDVPLVMGSAATDLRGSFGGFEGRPLRAGDVLVTGEPHSKEYRRVVLPKEMQQIVTGPIRVTRSAQQDWFNDDAFRALCSSKYVVTEQADRSGLRLDGEAIKPARSTELLTDGVPLGAIQIPPGGQPIILFVDQQTTGGYPKIAAVITADMHRIGQLKPGDEVRFLEVSVEQAVTLLREQEELLRRTFA